MQIKEFLLSQIAKLHYGNKFDKNKMTYAQPDVNFVSRTAANNGISDVVDRIDDVTPYPAGCVSLAFGGSIGSCFLQDKPFYTGQNVGVIEFSPDVPHEAKLYFVTALEKVCKAKYVTFSDEINKHFKTFCTHTVFKAYYTCTCFFYLLYYFFSKSACRTACYQNSRSIFIKRIFSVIVLFF